MTLHIPRQPGQMPQNCPTPEPPEGTSLATHPTAQKSEETVHEQEDVHKVLTFSETETLKMFRESFWEHRVPKNTKQSKDTEDFLLTQIRLARADERKKAYEDGKNAQKEHSDYNISMTLQSLDFFLSKDEEEYGELPLHGKIRAWIAKQEENARKA